MALEILRPPTSDPSTILSTVFDTNGHKVERLSDNRLMISRIDGTAIELTEANAVAAWFWAKVGIPEGDPRTTPPTLTIED